MYIRIQDQQALGALSGPTVRIDKVWRRPPFPRGLKAGILARGVARVLTKNLLGWFIRINPFTGTSQQNVLWLRLLDADLVEIAPEVDLTIEVFKKLKPKMSFSELLVSMAGYMGLRHGTDLRATPFWLGHIYSPRATTLPDKLGIDLEELLTAARIKGIPLQDIDKYFLWVYASFPHEIQRSMVPQQKFTLDEFGFDKAALPDSKLPEIKRIARLVVEREDSAQPIRTVRVVGHTDPVGARSYNINLGLRRASNVLEALGREIENEKPGVQEKIFGVTESLGEDLPIADNGTEAGRKKNRRVEIFLSGLGRAFALTGRRQRVPLESVVQRGLRLLRDQNQVPSVRLTEDEIERIKCLLQKVIRPGTNDRFVNSSLFGTYYATQRPETPFESLRNLLTFKDSFGPDVDDAEFLRKLHGLDVEFIFVMGRIAQIRDVQTISTPVNVQRLRNYILERAKEDKYNSVYCCYRKFLGLGSEMCS